MGQIIACCTVAEKEANEDVVYKKSVNKSTQVENMSTFDKSTQVEIIVDNFDKSTQVKNIVDNFDKITKVENIVDKSTQADRIYQEQMKNLSRGLLERCQMRKDRLHNLANVLNNQAIFFEWIMFHISILYSMNKYIS